MENHEIFQLISEQMNTRMDRIEVKVDGFLEKFNGKIDKLFTERNIICKIHDDKIDDLTTSVSILKDRQEQAESQIKRQLTIKLAVIGFVITLANAFVSFLLNQ